MIPIPIYLVRRYIDDIFDASTHLLVYAVVIGRQRPREPRLHTLHGYNPGASCISSPSQLNRYFVCILEAGGYWRHFYSDSEATAQCELFLTAPNRNIFTYLQ